MKSETEVIVPAQQDSLIGNHYKLLVESIKDYAIFLLDPNGNVATWNTGAERIKQYKAEEIIGKHFSIFYNEEARLSEYPAFELKEAQKQGRFEDEGWRLRKDGSMFWANVIITPVYNEQHTLIGFSKITRNLTEKKIAEDNLTQAYDELNKSEQRYRLLVEGVTDYAIFMLNPEGKVATWNEGAKKIKGYKADEIIGKHFSAFYSKEAVDNKYPEYELKKATAEGRFEDEGWRYRKDGSAFWANVVITAIYNDRQELIGFSKITRDLTERRRNEELMRKNNELLRINNDLDNFVYTASHDLKSPIVNLEGLLTALEEDLGSSRQQHEKLLSMMHGSITTLKHVIADLSDIAKLQQGKERPEKVNVLTLINEVKESLRDVIHSSKAQIRVDEQAFQHLNYSRKNLRSILFNLISNAIKYAHPERVPRIMIRTSMSENGEHVLSVADNGLGIPQNQLGKIFALFKRVHDHVEGSGIGLFLIKKILDNSGDSITVESQEGKGTVFTVRFHQGNSN